MSSTMGQSGVIILLVLAIQTSALRPADDSRDERLLSYYTGDMGADPDEKCDQCVGNLIDYHTLLQTTERPHVMVPALIVMFFGLLGIMMDTTLYFFTPVLFYWKARLNLSPEMAAATLLAVGNGAPDCADAIVSAEMKDLPLGLSNLSGSALFSICFSSGGCLLYLYLHRAERPSSEEVLSQSMYLELICFYIASILLVIVVLRRAEIKLAEAMALPLLYCVYIARVAWTTRGRADIVQERRVSNADEAAGGGRRRSKRRSSVEDGFDDQLRCLWPPDPADRTLLSWLFWTLALPTYVVRLVTIPPCDLRWDLPRRVLFSLCPVGVMLLCCFLGHVQSLSWEHAILLACGTLCWSALLFFTGNTGHSLPWYYTPMTIVSVVSCILWLGTLSTEMTSILEAFGRHFHVSRMRFGFTALAWGSTMMDAMTCITLATLGQSAMAFNGIIASQLFNITVGFGAALIAVTAQAGDGDVLLFWQGWPAPIIEPLVACALAGSLAVAVLVAFAVLDPHADMPFWTPVLWLLYVGFFVFMWFHTEHDVAQQIGAESS